MKQFFKFLFASIFGVIIGLFLFVGILIGIIGLIATSVSSDKELSIKENSILYMNFEEEITDRGSENPFDNFDFISMESTPRIGLNDILNNISKASKDPNIKGIFLDLLDLDCGFASQNEIRNALLKFKESGKFIIAYGDVMTQNAYYLATVADKIYLNPGGLMELAGLSSQRMFFKGTLEKLDVEVKVIRHGKFKSAVEPFILDQMSEENRLQTKVFVNSMWSNLVGGISTSRNISVQNLNEMINNLSVESPEDALKYGLTDGVKYRDEVISELKKLAEQDSSEEIVLVKNKKYLRVELDDTEEKSIDDYKNKVAIVYASGEIMMGESDAETMGSKTIAEAIQKARLDENVKSVVLRVNSPGGSSLASDIIWREVELTKAVKPVVVSMGNLAASGGYYIACGANRILADNNTITGSIGVFGLMPNAQGFFKNKLGITFDTVNTNTYSDIGSISRPMKKAEEAYVVKIVERIYSDFVNKVATGRSMTFDQVDSIGQGRVWSGTDALRLGLIDEIGGLERSIEIAAELGKVENYKIYELPEQKDPFEELVTQFQDDVESKMAKNYFGEHFEKFDLIRKSISDNGIYARMPFDLIIE